MKEQFLQILNQGDKEDIIPFLKKLTPEERKKLAPIIKEEDKNFSSWNSRRVPGADIKIKILDTARFVCLSAKDSKRVNRWDLPDVEVINQILEWYCPEWFSDLVNRIDYFRGRDYQVVSEWQDKGYIIPTPELIVTLLSGTITRENGVRNKGEISTETLEIYPITLNEHIWYLFEYPSNIEWEDKYYIYEEYKKTGIGNWGKIFYQYSVNGQLDRMRLLRECLLAVNRNFNKVLTGWFSDLFLALKPSREEQLELLDELFTTLSCVQTKPVNTTLTLFKDLCTEKVFRVDRLMEYLPVLLSSETKGIVKNTLTLIETILKNKSSNAKELGMAICPAFLVKDESIQKKAADIIVRYVKPDSDLTEQLSVYTDSILMSIRPKLENYLLPVFIESTTIEPVTKIVERQSLLINPIPEIISFEDFAFFASQALDLSEPYYYDQFINELIRWGNQVKESNIVLLEAVFQKMFKALMKWDTPLLDGLLHYTIKDYVNYLLEKFPSSIQNIHKLNEKFLRFDKESKEKSKYYKTRDIPLSKREVSDCYKGFKEISLEAIRKIKKQDTLPLLSTPTHQPIWIDPLVFIHKLIQYQEAGKEPANMDFQLALQRCALEDTKEALELAKQSLTDEYKELICFFLDKDAPFSGTMKHKAWWLTAAITRSPGVKFKEIDNLKYKGIPDEYYYNDYQWESYMEEYMAYGGYDREKKEYIRYPDTRSRIHQTTPEYDKKYRTSDWFMEYLFDQVGGEDTRFLIFAVPNAPDNIYKELAIKLPHWGSCAWEVQEKLLGQSAIKAFQELNTDLRDMHYFFLSMALLAGDKTVRDYAYHIWTDRITTGSFDSKALGKAIGRMEIYELCPLKRLTDLMSGMMIGVSSLHNKHLQEMIEAMLLEFDQPITNLKKLLEIFIELLAQNNARPSKEIKDKLRTWDDNTTLKKVIKQIVNN